MNIVTMWARLCFMVENYCIVRHAYSEIYEGLEMSKKGKNPFDDIRSLALNLPVIDMAIAGKTKDNINRSMLGLQPLGRLDEIVVWLAGLQGNERPVIERPVVGVFLGAHKVAEYVLGEKAEAGAKIRFEALAKGRAPVRGIAGAESATYKLYEMGLDKPAEDFRSKAALSQRACAAAIAYGMEIVADAPDLVVLGNAGFGAATAAAAIARGLYGGRTEYWAGGQNESAQRRIQAVEQAAHTHKAVLEDPLEVLRCMGGRDLAGLVGALLATRHQKIPVLLDGFAVCAAACVLHALNPDAVSHCKAAHLTAEPAHGALLDRLGLEPILDLGIGIGDGSGAAIALGIVRSAAAGARLL